MSNTKDANDGRTECEGSCPSQTPPGRGFADMAAGALEGMDLGGMEF